MAQENFAGGYSISMCFFLHSHRIKYMTPNYVQHCLFCRDQADVDGKVTFLTFDAEIKSHWLVPFT